jgi:hypothetical protein
MGTSEHALIPHILDIVVDENPGSVLDVGAGYGKYGVLVKEYTSARRVDGVDIDAPRHRAYDHFYLGDARDLNRVLPTDIPRYDLALFLEVIEHLEKAEGWNVLELLTRRARRVIVSTPLGFRKQSIPGLPYETHLSGWYPWEFYGRFNVHRIQVRPGNFTRHLRLPRMWQIIALISARPGS